MAITRNLSDASITPILQTVPEPAADQLLSFRATDMWVDLREPGRARRRPAEGRFYHSVAV
jgi:hypothetical protein